MEDLLRQLNEYLFFEFGYDLEEPPPLISEDSPFKLHEVGVIDRVSLPVSVLTFDSDGESFFAVAGDSLDFFPVGGMTLEDLADQFAGSHWIGELMPIDNNTSLIGDPSVPTAIERNQRLQDLASEHLGTGAQVLEGLFLRSNGAYLALVEGNGQTLVVSTALPTLPAGFPSASPWRRLSASVGKYLRNLRQQ